MFRLTGQPYLCFTYADFFSVSSRLQGAGPGLFAHHTNEPKSKACGTVTMGGGGLDLSVELPMTIKQLKRSKSEKYDVHTQFSGLVMCLMYIFEFKLIIAQVSR